ncbi:MAG: glycine cleavage system protein GcvH [Candidatus Freyarchaeota archaeon]|nr:glycine cleavage system protein GcvH [Candidatus Jordarchaeia archaeon]
MVDVIELVAGKFTIKIPKGLFYSQHDTWVRKTSPAIIGVTDYFQLLLGDVLYVNLPEEGSEINTVEEIGELESVKAVLGLYSPVSGRVVEVNSRIKEEPELINQDPYGDGWLLKVAPRNLEVDIANLMDAEGYTKLVEFKIREEQKRIEKQKIN